MKKRLFILTALLALGLMLGAPVLAEDVRGTELQLVVTETPEPTAIPEPTAEETPAQPSVSPSGHENPATGQGASPEVLAGTLLAAAVLLIILSAAPKKETDKK